MKRVWFMMLMMCVVSVFTACSDDDGEKDVLNPVTGISVPATGKIGNEVIIKGSGFTASGIAIYLENASQDRFKMDASFNNAGASFIVPFTLSVGTYSVVLVQNSEEWTLGTITLDGADNPVLALTIPDGFVAPGEEILLGGSGYETGDKISLQLGDATPVEISEVTIGNLGLQLTIPATCAEGTYVVSLVRGASAWVLGNLDVQKQRRVKSIYTMVEGYGDITLSLSYDSEGRLSSIVSEDGMEWNLTYGNNTIQTTSVMAGIPLDYTLEKGKVVKSSAFMAYDETEAYNDWSYEGDYLSSVLNPGPWYGGAALTVTYVDGNLTTLEELQCSYEYNETALKAVPNTIDPGFVLHLPALIVGSEDAVIALLCNVAGKTSAMIPTAINQMTGYTSEGEPIYTPFSISSTREGEVLKMVAEGYEAEITYEVY